MRWNPLNGNPVYAIEQIVLPDFDLVKIEATLVVEVSVGALLKSVVSKTMKYKQLILMACLFELGIDMHLPVP